MRLPQQGNSGAPRLAPSRAPRLVPVALALALARRLVHGAAVRPQGQVHLSVCQHQVYVRPRERPPLRAAGRAGRQRGGRLDGRGGMRAGGRP